MAEDDSVLTRKRKLTLAVTAAMYLIAVVIVWATIDEDVVEKAMSLPVSMLLIMLALSLANYAVRAWRWIFLSSHLRLGVPARHNGLYYFAGYALTATPGKAGEAIRLWLLKVGHATPYARSFPLMLADRVVDMWAVLLLVVISMSGFAAYFWQTMLFGGVVVLISVPIVFPATLVPLLRLAYSWLPRHGRLFVRLRRSVWSLDAATSIRAYGVTLPPTAAGWLAECAALYLILAFLGADVGLGAAVFVFCFSMLVGAISMLPGGLGSTEATMVFLLNAIGVGIDDALVATAIVRFTTFWFAVVLGLLSAPMAVSLARSASRLVPAESMSRR